MIVTTTTRPTSKQRARAHVVGQRCAAPVVPRRGALAAVLDAHGASLAYVVGRDLEWIASPSARLAADVGLLHAHVAAGARHPLVRAVGVPPGGHVVDATLGLAHDALHLATVAGVQVTGIEIQPALFSLVEAGLPRLTGSWGAGLVRPRLGDARRLLSTLHADAVVLSPMFDEPRRAPPGFELLRQLAHSAPLDASWLDAALRCAPRVVVKARRGQPIPSFAEVDLRQVVRGKAVDYWVIGPT